MSIQNYLNQIKTAVFGKDVRQSIHDAIKQCYDDASVDHDNANMEVKLARGTHETLNDRITENEKNQENLSSQLVTKANEIDLAIERERISNIVKNTGTSVNDLELQDIRVGADGVVYESAGVATRKQLVKKQDAILEYFDIEITLENGLYNNVTTAINTGKTEWKHTKITIEKDINYKISCRGASGEYSSIIGIDELGGRYVILLGSNVYTQDYLLKSTDIEKYVSLIINTADTSSSPIVVKKSQQADIIEYINDKLQYQVQH